MQDLSRLKPSTQTRPILDIEGSGRRESPAINKTILSLLREEKNTATDRTF